MSGTLNNIHNNVSFALNRHYEVMARLQEQAYTGSRINRASDDPSDAYRVLGLKSQKRQMANYMDNISSAIEILNVSSSVFSGYGDDEIGIESIIAKTKELLTSVTDTGGDAARNVNKQGIKDYLDEIISYANWKYNGQYLFGGSNTGSAPYTVTRDGDGHVTSVTYQGSSLERNIEVAPGVQSSTFYAGDDIFASHNRGDSEFVLGNTGAESGTGTSSVTGYTWLTVTADGGGSYDLSIDDGATTVNVAAASDITNIAVTNANGDVLYIDGTNIDSTGVELVSNTGTHDIFNTLITISKILENENNFASGQLKTMRNNTYEAVEELSGRLSQTSVSMGMRIGFLETLKGNLDNIKFNVEDEMARLEEADIAQLAIAISRREVLYQMSLSVAARVMSMSLLDFI
jgi:flagellar hook-associated protein 3 FlgL